ncbi:MAG: RloB family protein [Prevotellaceae bacterium]|jgi:hypothetical protein|nr:RloB family protein [Prevotellaceae bacterium]
MRNYAKSNPEKPVIVSQQKKHVTEDVSLVSPIKDAGLNYRKEEGKLLPKSFFVIVSGGEKTERLYFKIIANSDRFQRIKIEFIADPAKLNPIGLLETASYKQEHYKTSQTDKPDEIYIVSDVDHFVNELLKIKPECEKLNIYLIISNSCFEVWLYYAYFNEIKGFKAPENILKISKHFRQWMPHSINPTTAIFNIQINITNAKVNYTEDSNGIPTLFSTNMFILAESLLPFIQDELQKMIEENKKKMKL